MAIDDIVANTVFPDTVSPASSAMTQMMMEEFNTLVKAILTAVFLVFLVMAIQFESPIFVYGDDVRAVRTDRFVYIPVRDKFHDQHDLFDGLSDADGYRSE